MVLVGNKFTSLCVGLSNRKRSTVMNNVIYLVGLVVVVGAILSFVF